MGRRRKEKLFNVLIRLPWWMGAIGAILMLALRPLWMVWAENGAGMLAPVMRQSGNFFYLVAGVFALGMVASLFRQWWYGRLLDRTAFTTVANANSADTFGALDWRDFERILQEAFRRQGYLSVESQSGPDGGYDIALRKDGKRYLVQCKHWKSRQIGVAQVRELWGVIAASKADGGFLVCSGQFTEDAKAFASGVNLVLIDGHALKQLLAASNQPGHKQRFKKESNPSSREFPNARNAVRGW